MSNQEQIDAGLSILDQYRGFSEHRQYIEPYETGDYIFACNLHPVDMHIDDIEHLTELDWHWDEDVWMWKHELP